MKTPPATNEPQRLAALRRYAILDTPSELPFDDLTLLASHICQTPIALISLVDEARQWFKSRVGLEVPETGREISFCTHAIHYKDEILEVRDARLDPRFVDNPLVTSEPNICFYAGTPLVDDAGYALGTLCVIDRVPRTLTDAQRQALRALGRHVMTLIVTRQTNEQLRIAMMRAEAADRIKSEFLATMSHELRTPLNSIIGFTGVLLQNLAGPLNTEQAKQLGMVHGSAHHLLALINDVLDISKIEAGELQVACEPFDLRMSVSKVAGIVKPLADKKGLTLRVELPPPLSTVAGDPRRVEQILLNLLNNAIKFTQRGEVALTAGVDAARVRVRVTDTGIGIKPEDMKLMFQPFRQIDTGLSRKHEGTGLGLAICQRLAGLMGADIRAESVWGRGSTFSFTLPLKEAGRS